ncbi:hypothetical protein CQ010_01325 [Arthrobacter sp. MYb211]|uniref:hypothetical protein n=1 Tax=unclassified Arthrobacter TaxID=235627 RepID=UPI000CFC4BAB|nr:MULTISPECIES: hypothetical protein [unclassified Arthrobacter]PRA13315.1 hypothetical protein CQ015_03580 [Arthrobacter sp. MYb221]PRC10512.1 hypothetical protein CQ010_01325 [Arthrobacter sp. MYb211]
MGANEKLQAAMHGWTPDTSFVMGGYEYGRVQGCKVSAVVARAEFDRWLNQVYAEAQAKALEEVSSELKSESETFANTAERLTGDDNTRYFAYAAARKSIAYRLKRTAQQLREQS